MGTKNEMLIRVAELYYEQKLSQNDISDILGVSRSSISRLLDEARDAGIVEIIVHNPLKSNADLSYKLREALGLRDAIVFTGKYTRSESFVRCGSTAAKLLSAVLENSQNVGITWGRATQSFVRMIEPFQYYGVSISQMVGCLGTGNPIEDGIEIAILLSRKLNGTYSNIYAPIYVSNESVYEYLLAEPQIRNAIEHASHTDIVFTGVGTMLDDSTALVRTGHLNEKQRQAILDLGAVGHLLARHYDIDGNEIRIDGCFPVAAPLSALRAPKLSVGMCTGTVMMRAVLAAVRAKYINVLIADEDLSYALIAEVGA